MKQTLEHFPRGAGINAVPAHTASPTSPQLPVCVSLGGGAGAHTPAPQILHATICGTCLRYMAGNREVLTKCLPGTRIDVAGPCADCAGDQPHPTQLPRVFLHAAIVRHLEQAKRLLRVGDHTMALHELTAAARLQEEINTLAN